MIRRIICLLLACLIPIEIFCACEDEDAEEMTAVTMVTAEPTEATETDEVTEATEEKRNSPVQTTYAYTEAPTEVPTETEQLPSESLPPLTESLSSETEAPTEPTVDLRSFAKACIGASVSILYDLIGYPPNGSSYTENGIGEDGELYYNGFTVYTYREAGVETVIDVR